MTSDASQASRWGTAHSETALGASLQAQPDSLGYFFTSGEHMIAAWISHGPFYFTDVTCTSAPKRHFSFASGLAALSLHTDTLFGSRSAFLPELLTRQVLWPENGYMCIDMSYNIPKEVKRPLAICIDFSLPTKINFKTVAICRKTQGLITGG